VGDIVKISKAKLIFDKEATQSWTSENFKILEVLSTLPWTYKLRDKAGNILPGGFYFEQLQKVHPDSLYDD